MVQMLDGDAMRLRLQRHLAPLLVLAPFPVSCGACLAAVRGTLTTITPQRRWRPTPKARNVLVPRKNIAAATATATVDTQCRHVCLFVQQIEMADRIEGKRERELVSE